MTTESVLSFLLHGGGLHLESAPDHGTTAVVKLPIGARIGRG
jgi:signal transduction histidine kinase